MTIGTLTPGASSSLNFNTAAGGANAATTTVGTGVVTLTNAVVFPNTFTVTDAGGFGLATLNGSNNVVRVTSTTLLPAFGATLPTDYRVDNNGGGAAAAGSSTLVVTASQSAGSVTVDSTAAAGTLTLGPASPTTTDPVVLSGNVWNFGGAGSNTYQVVNGATAAAGSGITSVASGNGITFNNNNTGMVTIASPILANGANLVTFNGTGTTALAGANTYTGGTTLTGGATLQVGAGGTTGVLGAGTVTINTGSTLAFNRSDAMSVSNLIAGAGNVVQSNATGTTTLTGANTYTGSTTVSRGTLVINTNNTATTSGYTVNDANTGSNNTTLSFIGSLSNNRAGAGATQLHDVTPVTVAAMPARRRSTSIPVQVPGSTAW